MGAGRRPVRRTLLLLVGIVLLAAGPARTQERSWHLRSFRAQIQVRADGSLRVTEVLRPDFRGSYRGIYRTIPVEYRSPAGFDYDLDLEVVSVTDGRGSPLRHETGRDGRYLKVQVWIPGARDTVRTVAVRYRVDRALRHHEEYDELYWNVTGTEWGVPIDTAAATIELPEGVTGVRVRSHTGPFGSRSSDAEVRTEGSRIHVGTAGRLEYGEGLTAAAAWDPGVVERPGLVDRTAWFLDNNGILLLPLLAGGLMFWLWYRRGRDPTPGSVAPRYEPPEGLTPAEVGVLVDDRPDVRDLTATLVDLAVRGYVEIEARRESNLLGLSSDREYTLHRRRPPAEWGDLREHEERLLEGVFADGRDSVELSELEDDFYRHLPEIRDEIFAALMQREVYRQRPDEVRRGYVFGGVVAGTVLLVLGLGFGDLFSFAPLPATVGALGTGAMVTGFGWFMPVRTRSGTNVYGQVLGFEEFLQRVEEDRFRRMITGPEMFEEYLPHAMALGVEKKWARAFEEMYRRPPEWYSGTTSSGFDAGLLASDLRQLSSRAGSAMTSRPRSSGGSSFSGGGGFSGGGFGGGGGGAF